jgi:chromosome segregation ATPase
LDIKLSEIAAFIEWLQLAAKALNQGHPLPQHPNLDGSEALSWIKAVETLDERRRQSDEKLSALETDLRAREAHLGRVTQQLQGCMQETKAAQAACDTLREEVAGYAAMQSRIMEMSKGLDGLEEQIRKMASDFSSRAAHLNGLTTILKELSVGFQSLAKKA